MHTRRTGSHHWYEPGRSDDSTEDGLKIPEQEPEAAESGDMRNSPEELEAASALPTNKQYEGDSDLDDTLDEAETEDYGYIN